MLGQIERALPRDDPPCTVDDLDRKIIPGEEVRKLQPDRSPARVLHPDAGRFDGPRSLHSSRSPDSDYEGMPPRRQGGEYDEQSGTPPVEGEGGSVERHVDDFEGAGDVRRHRLSRRGAAREVRRDRVARPEDRGESQAGGILQEPAVLLGEEPAEVRHLLEYGADAVDGGIYRGIAPAQHPVGMASEEGVLAAREDRFRIGVGGGGIVAPPDGVRPPDLAARLDVVGEVLVEEGFAAHLLVPSYPVAVQVEVVCGESRESALAGAVAGEPEGPDQGGVEARGGEVGHHHPEAFEVLGRFVCDELVERVPGGVGRRGVMIAVGAQRDLARPGIRIVLDVAEPPPVIGSSEIGQPPDRVPVRPTVFVAGFGPHRVAVGRQDRIRQDDPVHLHLGVALQQGDEPRGHPLPARGRFREGPEGGVGRVAEGEVVQYP